MARQKSIRYQMKSELHTMEAYGRSKRADQIKTMEERSNAKAKGIPYEEYRQIDYTKDYIYSHNTMRTYQHEIDRFADYLAEQKLNKITMEEAKEHIQEYLSYLESEKKLSPQSIHTACASLCKTFHTTMWEYEKPNRSVAKLTRGTKTFDKSVDMIQELQKNHIWQINREYLGMRKNELINLKAGMIQEKGDKVIIDYIGKGGKLNHQIFTREEEKAFVLSLKNGKNDNEHIFDKQEVKQALNLHKARELRCKDVYNRILSDIEKRGRVAEQEYIKEIKQIFKEANKTLRENLDNPYYVRGENRQRLLEANRPVEYNRIALMYVSVTVSQHFRTNTTANFYIAK